MKKVLAAVLVTVMVFALAAGSIVSAAASVAIESLDNVYVNEAQLFNGGADAWFAANEIKGKIQSIGIRGWIIMGDSQVPSSFGYRIDDGEPVKCADSVVYDQAIVDATGYANIRRDVFTADVSKVGLGEHTFTIAAWNDADEVAYGKSFTFTQELAPDEEPPAVPPAIKGNNLDAWKYWQNGGLIDPPASFVHGTVAGFHIAGWFGFNYDVLAVGYRLNGVETFVDGALRAAEQPVKDIAGDKAVRYDMDGSFATALVGANTFDIIVKLDDPDQSVVNLFAGIPLTVLPNSEDAVLLYDTSAAITTGYWMGPEADVANGNIALKFTSPDSFNGVFMFVYSNHDAVVDANLYNKDGTLLETVTKTYTGDSYKMFDFSKVYPAGEYTLDFVFAGDTGYFVLGSGTPTEVAVTASGVCNNQYPDSAPALALIKAELPETVCTNAAFDDLHYDDTVLCSSKAYTWVADPANQEALNYELGEVSSIYFRGWAQLSTAITGFGYVIDDGEPVVDAAFVQDRAAELEGAGFPGAQGYEVTVPVDALEAGNHTIKIVAIDEYGRPVDIVKVKNEVNYPVAISFTVTEYVPVLIGQSLDYWAHFHAGADCAAAAVFDVDQYDGFHTAGWVGYDQEIVSIGYRLNGVNVFSDTIAIAEGNDAVKAAGGEFAVNYDMYGSFEGAVVGDNELYWIAELADGSIVEFFGPYNFTCTEVGGTTHPQSTLFADAVLNNIVHGWWTGPVVTGATGGLLNLKLEAPWAFNGICLMMYANSATVNVNLFNEAGIMIDSVQVNWATDGVETAYFSKAYAPGVYTIQFEFVDGNYFVFATGTPSNIPVEVTMNGFIGNGDTLPAPVAFLTGANNPGQPKEPVCLNAAYDELHYDDTVLCSAKAYTWVADPANREALDFEKTSVSEIYMKGWAQIDKPLYCFGYRIDGGEVVIDDAFTVDRAAELEGAGYPGAQGFGVTVPVETLASGEHTIEVIAVDEDGKFVPVVKVKNEVEYPVGVTFTVTKLQDHESVLTDRNFDRYFVEGVELGQGGTGAYAGNVHTNIINKYPQAYAKTGSDEITITGWAGFDGEHVESFGYKIDDQPSVTSPDFIVNRNAELANAGFPYGQGYSITFSYAELEPGEHTVTLFATALDEEEHEMLTYTFTVSEIGAWLYDTTQPITIDGQGWWTGEALSISNGSVSIEFESPIAFDGIYTIYWANSVPGAVMEVSVYDENDDLLDTITAAFMFNGKMAYKFNQVFAPGTYTIEYYFAESAASHFVLGAGQQGDIATVVYGNCNNSGDATWSAPSVGLLYAELPPTECTNAAFDELKYDDTALVSSKAYTWVADPANQEALNYELGEVSSIYFRGWAQLSTAITGFGYVIDDGEPVVDAAFVQDRAAELEGAGFPGAQGYEVTVPVADLAVGEHSIKIVAIDANGEPVGIIKVKNEVVYPVAITFTVSEKAIVSPAELIRATFDLFDLSNGVLTVQGWAGANFPANNLGYRIDDGEDILDGIEFANFNTPAEGETIKSLAGPDAFRFKSRGNGVELDLEPGEHKITILMRVNDGTQNYIVEMGSKTFTVTGQPDPAVRKGMSFNTIWVDGQQICDIGDALTVCPLVGKMSTIGLRGWVWIGNSTIESVGYKIDDGEPVVDAAWIQDRADVRAALGGLTADVCNGFNVQGIDVSGLANGEHTITVLCKAADGTYVEIVKVPIEIKSAVVMQEFNWYAVDGVVLSSAGEVDKLVKENHQTYLKGGYEEIGFLGKVALAGNEPITGFGYSVDGGEIVSKDVFFSRIFNAGFDYTAELTAAGYPNGEGFWIVMNYTDLEPGDHTLTYYVMASDGTPIEMMSYDFTVAEVIWFYNKQTGFSTGFWTGPNCGRPTGNISIEFTTEEAFNGVYQIFYADYADCLVDINLYDGDEELLETIHAHFYDNSRSIEYFENVYPAGSYILEYQYVGEVGHFVLGSGNASELEVTMYGDYGTNENTFAAPTVALMKAEYVEPVEAACTNAAFDDLWYDDVKLCTAKAYAWVADEANKEALNYTEGTVSQIYFRGWAQLNKPLAGFGYVIDDGEVVSDPSFIQDRAAELEGAGFPGAQGYAIWVPVEGLAVGEHTIKIVAISEDEEVVDIFKAKEGVDYPVAISFTIAAGVIPPEFDLGDVNMDGELDNKDVVTLFRYVSMPSHETELPLEVADMNNDGFIDNKDVVVLFRMLSTL